MSLSSYGYSDILLDNTPGFQGREYLSGEWGAAVSYKVGNSSATSPTWLQPDFIYPDWTTNSNFREVTPITITQSNNGYDTHAMSVIENNDLRITINYAMVDTITGMRMGTSPGNAATGSSIESNRYVMQQSYTVTNISGKEITGLSLFQMLHSLHGEQSLYDNHAYTGALSDYRYDTTQVASDPSWGTSFKDYISFASNVAPVAFENDMYGTFADDNHASGKPSIGTHLLIEDNALGGKYFFNGTGTAWVAGAQKYSLGTLADGASKTIDLMLSVKTGTTLTDGASDGNANGDGGNPGCVNFKFDQVTTPGSFFAEYSTCDENELDYRASHGEFEMPEFYIPGTAQLFELDFDGEFDGAITLTFSYDPTLLGSNDDESLLKVFHFSDGRWQDMGGVVDTLNHTITIETESLSPFVIGASGPLSVPEPGTLAVLGLALPLVMRRRR